MFRSKSSRETMRQMAKKTEKERLDKLKKKQSLLFSNVQFFGSTIAIKKLKSDWSKLK